ncbi:MAG: hypothetical protein P8J32_04895 [bacterium]|nr:hypothetical protein [bacterium]
MKKITPIIAIITIDDEPTSFAALSVAELYDSLQVYAKETEDMWVEWMAALPAQADIEKAAQGYISGKGETGTENTVLVKDHTIGDWDEYIQIEVMPQWWVDNLITPFTDKIEQLAGELNSMIGHPENPFAENILSDLVEKAFDLIKKEVPPLTDYSEE